MVASPADTRSEKTPDKILPLIDDAERLEERLKEVPLEPGVYYMRDASDQILYIGKSKRLRSRLRQYFNGKDTRPRIQLMMRQVTEIEVIVTDT
jgi:excinuclease ABC subunit C